MIKRKLFIGSSTQGLKVANEVKDRIVKSCDSWLDVELWTDSNVFKLSKTTLENLQEKSILYDYGVLIATSDDVGEIKDGKYDIMRDNVLFEAGMFLATLGRERAFVMMEKGCRIPTDLLGQTLAIFSGDELGTLDKCIDGLLEELNNTKDTFKFSRSSSTALALGYYKNYIKKIIDKVYNDKMVDFIIKIKVPLYPNNIHAIKDKLIIDTNSIETNFIKKQERPTIFIENNGDGEVWDIPTTIEIICDVIRKIVPSSELTLTKQQKEYVEQEVRNFVKALMALLEENYPHQSCIKIEIIE